MAQADLTFLHGQSVVRCDHHIDKHYNAYQTLQYTDGGAVSLSVGAKEEILRGRWFWSCYPGPRFEFHAHPTGATWVHRYIAFQGALVGRWVAEGIFPVRPQKVVRGFGGRFDSLLESALDGGRLARLRAINLLEGILIELAEAREARVEEGWLKEAIEKLSGEGGVDYERVAGELGMGGSTFRRRFRLATGVGPHVYVVRSRVGRAREMLVGTELPIKVIAKELGYSDVYFFSRQFRQMTGVPPGAYRKSRHG